MSNIKYDCGDCRFLNETYDGTLTCTKLNKNLNDFIENCKHFKKLQFCNTCAYSNVRVYETGTIDSIVYRCSLQNNKLIYEDTNPMTNNNADRPECNIGLYEEAQDER